jgi:tRNA-specific 2-thiouridylase
VKVKKGTKILLAISGGVDSSTTAFLLKKQGCDVIGVFMRLGANQGSAESAARHVCQKLGIKFYPYNVAPRFKKEVIDYFLDSYAKGFTPNPCVNCNKLIKFGELLKLADDLGCDYLASGHYVKNEKLKIK